MNWLGDATLILQIVTALFIGGMLHALTVGNYKMAAYYFFAAGLQVVVIWMGKS